MHRDFNVLLVNSGVKHELAVLKVVPKGLNSFYSFLFFIVYVVSKSDNAAFDNCARKQKQPETPTSKGYAKL